MKVAIITQPIEKNFGGVLQNFALQTVLRRLGHDPMTIDYRVSMPVGRYLLTLIKALVFWLIPSRRYPIPPYRNVRPRDPKIAHFVENNMKMSAKQYYSYSAKAITDNHCEAIIVGSDQVWRPCYNPDCLYDMYLKFAKHLPVKKLAYAVSFGTSDWEYTERQTLACAALVKQFDGVSVRESSGADLCRHHLGVDSIVVLDPTLLLEKEDYERACAEIPLNTDEYVCVYVLGKDGKALSIAKKFAENYNMPLKVLKAEHSLSCSIEEWLATFRDAAYVITDSFHGTAFSILFQKEFYSVVNRGRGADRFFSLLQSLGLESRLCEDDNIKECGCINWAEVYNLRSSYIEKSINILKEHL